MDSDPEEVRPVECRTLVLQFKIQTRSQKAEGNWHGTREKIHCSGFAGSAFGHFCELRPVDRQAVDGVVFELREHKRLELTKLFATRETMPPLLKSFLSIVQSANRSWQSLGMYFAQIRELLLSLGQVVLLTMVGRKRFVGGNDIFLLQRTPVYWELTRRHPVFEFALLPSYTRLYTSQAN